jgi:hypothetical protein
MFGFGKMLGALVGCMLAMSGSVFVAACGGNEWEESAPTETTHDYPVEQPFGGDTTAYEGAGAGGAVPDVIIHQECVGEDCGAPDDTLRQADPSEAVENPPAFSDEPDPRFDLRHTWINTRVR